MDPQILGCNNIGLKTRPSKSTLRAYSYDTNPVLFILLYTKIRTRDKVTLTTLLQKKCHRIKTNITSYNSVQQLMAGLLPTLGCLGLVPS